MLTVSKLINRAYGVGRIYPSRGYDLTSKDLKVGLDYLNLIIDEVNVDASEISFNSFFSTNLIPGDSLIEIPGFVKIYTAYYLLENVRLPLKMLTVDEFYSQATVTQGIPVADKPANGYSGVPFVAWPEITETGINLHIHSSSSSPYRLEINGLKNLNNITVADLGSKIENSTYFSFFVYSLAQMLRNHHQLDDDARINAKVASSRHSLQMTKPQNVVVNNKLGSNNWFSNLSKAGPMSVSKGFS